MALFRVPHPHNSMCIPFQPRTMEISEIELEAADQAAVDHEEEDEYYESDAESYYEIDAEIEDDFGMEAFRNFNHFMNDLGEAEVSEEKWIQLSVFQKQFVLYTFLSLDPETEMKDRSEQGKEALAQIRAIVEGKSDENEKEGSEKED